MSEYGRKWERVRVIREAIREALGVPQNTVAVARDSLRKAGRLSEFESRLREWEAFEREA